MIWVKDLNEDREDPGVDIFNIIQKVQDTGIHLEVDEEQWKITQGCQRQAQCVWSPRTMSGLRLPDTPYAKHQTTTIHAFRSENNVGVSSQPMNDTTCFASNKPKCHYFLDHPP